MNKLLKNFMIFCVGFTMYQSMEGVWKTFPPCEAFVGAESFTMGILGGLAILLIGQINKKFSWSTPIWLQALIGGLGITVAEFFVGLFMNKWLCPLLDKPLIWDYSMLPGNFMGQICPQFTCLWIILSFVSIFVDDFLRWKVYNEDKPKYTLWWK